MYIKTLFLFIIFILFFLSLFPYRRHVIYPNLLKKMKGCHQNILKMLKDVLPYLQKNNISYFITDGTLLGYIRHQQKFIPYDDDIDLGIIKDDKIGENIQNLEDDISPLGYRILPKSFGWAIYYQDPQVIGYIDLFLMVDDGEGRYILDSEIDRKVWPKEYFYHNEIFPLVQDYFEGVLVNIPNQPIVYLKRFYGENVLDECILTHFHQGNPFDRAVIKITNIFSQFKIDLD